MNYTKGEWKTIKRLSSKLRHIVFVNHGVLTEVIAHVRYQNNAHLIAAAPEMYEALKSLMVAYGAIDGRNGNSGECWDKARTAVTKAEEGTK